MMHRAWSNVEEVSYCFSRSSIKFQGHGTKKIADFERFRTVREVPYNFSRSSIKFQGHTGWKINDLNPIWVRLLGQSQLSNPLDLPCFIYFFITYMFQFSRYVTCCEFKCRPTWWPNFHNLSVHHLSTPSLPNWRQDANAYHFTWPVPPELKSEASVMTSNTMFAQMGKYILEQAGRLPKQKPNKH